MTIFPKKENFNMDDWNSIFDDYQALEINCEKLEKELNITKEALIGIYKARGELDKLNCKVMRIPNIMNDI